MNRRLGLGLSVIAVLFLALIAAALVFVYTADYNRYKRFISDAVTDATGRQLVIKGDLTIAISLQPEIVVTDLALANASWGSQPEMAHVGQLRIRFELLPLLRGDVNVTRLKLVDTEVLLETNAAGQANWQFGHKAAPRRRVGIRRVAVQRVAVEGLAVRLRSGESGSPAKQYNLDSFKLSRSAAADSMDVELKGSSNGQPVALSGQTGPLEDLFAGAPFPLALSGDIAGTAVKLQGEMTDALTREGLDLTVQASGTDLAGLGAGLAVELPQTDRFDIAAHLTGSGDDLRLEKVRGSARYKSLELAADGGIGDLIAFEGIDLNVKGSGKDLAELGPLLGQTLPQTGPFQASGRLTGTAKALALSDVQGTIGRQGIEVSLSGRVDDLIALEGIDLGMTGSGKDLAELGPVLGQTLPQTGTFQASGRLTGTAKALALSDVQGTIGLQSIEVSLAGGIDDLIALEGIDLKVKGSGKDLAELGPVLGQTLPQTGPFQASGTLTGTAHALSLSEAQASLVKQSVTVSVAGRVADLMTLKGISLDLRGSGKTLGELRGLLGETFPDTGPFSVTGRLTGSAQALAVRSLQATVRQGSSQLTVSGRIGDLRRVADLDLTLEGSGRDFGELGPLFDAQLPDLGPFRMKGQLGGSDTLIELKSFSAMIDQSDFSGWAQVEVAKRPRVTLRLESGLLDFTQIMEQVQGETQGAKSEAGGARQAMFSDQPLPFEVLDAVDADIAFNARNIKARDAGLEFGQLAFTLEEGDLRVEKLAATYRDTRFSASLNLVPGRPRKVDMRFLVQGFDLGRFLKETHVSQEVEGQADLAADLASEGDTPHRLMAHLDGVAGAVIGKGYVPRFLDFLAQDLSRRVITIWGHHREAGELNCGVIQFSSNAGVATSDAFLFDTQLGILKGDGEINLATEQLDFVLSPKPKDTSLFSLATKLRVTGSILDPSVRPDTRSLAKKGVKALSALVVGPAGLLLPFMRTGARHPHLCDIQELKSRIQSIYE